MEMEPPCRQPALTMLAADVLGGGPASDVWNTTRAEVVPMANPGLPHRIKFVVELENTFAGKATAPSGLMSPDQMPGVRALKAGLGVRGSGSG